MIKGRSLNKMTIKTLYANNFPCNNLIFLFSVVKTCGQTTSENCTYFEQSNMFTTGGCMLTVCKCNTNICQVNIGLLGLDNNFFNNMSVHVGICLNFLCFETVVIRILLCCIILLKCSSSFSSERLKPSNHLARAMLLALFC